MREEMPERMIQQKANYTETIALMNVYNQTPTLEINLLNKTVRANNIAVPMANAEMAFLAWIAQLTQAGIEGVAIPYEGSPDLTYAEGFKACYEIINNGITDKVESSLKKGMDKSYFNDRKTKIKSTFNKALGKRSAEKFSLQPIKKIREEGSAMQYGLKISPENIKVVSEECSKVEPIVVLSKQALKNG